MCSDFAPALAKLVVSAPIVTLIVAVAWVKIARIRAGNPQDHVS